MTEGVVKMAARNVVEMIMKRSPRGRNHCRSTTSQGSLVVWILLGLGCGWRSGPVDVASLSVGQVTGATVEPGLRTASEDALARQLRWLRVPAGPELDVEIVRIEHQPVASTAAGADMWSTRLTLELSVAERRDCAVEVTQERSWRAVPSDPADAAHPRTAAVVTLAEQTVVAGLDVLLGSPACR